MKDKLFICATQHKDLVWRRCFDRRFEYNNQCFVSYADLAEYYILENIKFCDKYDFYKFTVESVAFLKKYLERRPQDEAKIKELIDKGQLFIPFSGNNIVDSNLINGECIVRNYLYGYKYLKDKFDFVPYGMDRADAFGNSAQLPQIARKFGTKWIYNLSYTKCENQYWRGLDGSRVFAFTPEPVATAGGWYKYRPCPACNGYDDKDCEVCGNKRIDIEFSENFRNHIKEFEIDSKSSIPAHIKCGGEEILPGEDVINWALDNTDKYDITFIGYDDYIPYIEDSLDMTDSADEALFNPSCELNPNNTGCYVTRINLKQTLRENENAIFTAETFCVLDYLKNKSYPHGKLENIWEKMLFTSFHDSVTGTHVNAGYEEIMDATNQIKKEVSEIKNKILIDAMIEDENTVTVYNPYGFRINADVTISVKSDVDISLADCEGNLVSISDYQKNDGEVEITFLVNSINAFSKKEYKIVRKEYEKETTEIYKVDDTCGKPILTNEIITNAICDDKEFVIENEYFKVTATKTGIKEIFDKKLNQVIARESEYMVGEWILEHDEGSPWATHSEDMRRQKMSVFTTLTKIEETADIKKLVFNIRPQDIDAYSILGFRIQYSVILQKNCDMVKFEADVFWYTQNYRLRIAIPTIGEGKHFYDIPYGVIERKPYKPKVIYPNGMSDWSGAAGDYPAINWAGVSKTDYSLAMFNKGIPSYQINNDNSGNATIYLTPLRSPSIGSYLYSPSEYVMRDYDGMMDSGEHHFEYAIKAYKEDFSKNSAVTDGFSFNAQLSAAVGKLNLPELPKLISKNARISNIKVSEDGKGIIYRINEYHGISECVKLVIPCELKLKGIYETNLKEEIESPLNEDNFTIKPFEIKTIYFEL